MSYRNGKLHHEIQAAVDSRPAVLEPWGMFHILEACDKIANERDDLRAALAQRAEVDATNLLQRWYDLYGGSTMEIREKYPEDKYAQGEMATLDKDTEQFLGIESQYQRTDMNSHQGEK